MTEINRMENECRYEYLSPAELQERLNHKAILYLPIGSLEWHNEHLPLGTDTFCGLACSIRFSKEIGGVALPPFWWNTGSCHDHSSTYYMPETIYRETLANVCLGLKSIPAKLLVLVNGHAGKYQRETMPLLADELNQTGFPMLVIAPYLYGFLRSAPLKIDHADTAETSFAMEMIPQLVRLNRPLVPDPLKGVKPFINRGTPSASIGKEMWNIILPEMRALIEAEYKRAESG